MLKWRWSRRWGRALGGAHSKSGAGWIVKLHASICRGTHRCLSSAAGKGDKRVPEGGGIEAGSFRAIICDVGLKLPANMALRVEIVGARELLSSSNMWGLNSINPSVVIKMGAAEASTALLESKSNPVRLSVCYAHIDMAILTCQSSYLISIASFPSVVFLSPFLLRLSPLSSSIVVSNVSSSSVPDHSCTHISPHRKPPCLPPAPLVFPTFPPPHPLPSDRPLPPPSLSSLPYLPPPSTHSSLTNAPQKHPKHRCGASHSTSNSTPLPPSK